MWRDDHLLWTSSLKGCHVDPCLFVDVKMLSWECDAGGVQLFYSLISCIAKGSP